MVDALFSSGFSEVIGSQLQDVAEMAIDHSLTQADKGPGIPDIAWAMEEGHSTARPELDQLKGAQLVVVEGTVYPLLTRMKNEGLLTYRWQESTGGPPRKYYTLTENGQQFLAQLDQEWQSICQAINRITTPDPNNIEV